jgi:hypothetical protein
MRPQTALFIVFEVAAFKEMNARFANSAKAL